MLERGGSKRARFGSFALVLAPLLALSACDQVGKILQDMQQAQVEAPGPAPMEAVPVDARAVAGAVLPEAEIAAMLAPEPAEYIPGELLIGAKVEDALAQAQGLTLNAFKNQFADEVVEAIEALDLDPKVVEKATETALVKAERDATIVLKRLGIDDAVTIDAQAGGVLKIDLRPEVGSPTRWRQAEGEAPPAGAAPDPAVPSEPTSVVETDLRCPRGVTEAQLEADLVLATQCTLERLRASRQFDFVEKNYVVKTSMEWLRPAPPKPAPAPGAKPAPGQPAPAQPSLVTLPNDPLLPLQWHFRGRGSGAGQSPGGAGFEPFWVGLKQVGQRAVKVAVIDTGVDMAHPDIKGSPNLAPGIDLVSNWDRGADGDGIDADANDVGDACGPSGVNSYHGTHVAGTVGAALTNDRRGVAGGAWNVTVVPVRAIGKCGGALEDIVNAVRWSAGLAPAETEDGRTILNANPADVINMSLSVAIPCPASMQSAIDAAVARGSVVVVAAGNKANAVANFAPANCRNVLVVAANDARGGLAFYSNFGPEVDVLAPGGDLFNDTDGDGRPDGVLSTKTQRTQCIDPTTGAKAEVCYYGYDQGTSMAAPHVAAALALLKSQYNVSGRALEDLLLTRAVSPIDPGQCQIQCERNRNAEAVPGQPGVCMRRCGRGMLDLARLAPQPPAGAAAAKASR